MVIFNDLNSFKPVFGVDSKEINTLKSLFPFSITFYTKIISRLISPEDKVCKKGFSNTNDSTSLRLFSVQ